MTLKLEWYGQKEFISTPLRGWNVTSDRSDHESYEAGLVRNSGPLTFATIHGGGHMVRLLRLFILRGTVGLQ